MKTPTYSIVIPVYMRVFGFHQALASALAVTGCQEVVVVDDNSDHDEFRTIAESFGDPRIKFHKNTKNAGLFANWNKGIELAQGEFVSVLCSDDVIEADAYERFAAAYAIDPELDVFFGSFCTFTDDPTQPTTFRTFPKGKMAPLDLMADAVIHGPGFSVLSIIRRATALKFPFLSKPHSGNDWLWIYGNAASFKLHATDRPINYWRRHADQDAAKSQSTTMDCWPLMYRLMEQQLRSAGHPLADRASRRAKGIILNWLLNDYAARNGYFPRLRGDDAKSHPFLQVAREIVDGDWVLRGLLASRPESRLHFTIGRMFRKMGFYPAA